MRWILALLLATSAHAAEPPEEAGTSLQITDLSLSEGLEREAFLKAIHTRWDRLEACYSAALSEHPTLGGQWGATLGFVKKKGVVEVERGYSSINLESLDACYAEALAGLMFEEDRKAAGRVTLSLLADPGDVPKSAYEAASRYAGGKAELGEITTVGGLDAGAVTNAVTDRLAYLRGCFSESLRRRPMASALVVLKLRTEAGGAVEGVELIRSNLRDDTAERCMVAMARGLDVETAEDANPGVATIPVSLAGD